MCVIKNLFVKLVLILCSIQLISCGSTKKVEPVKKVVETQAPQVQKLTADDYLQKAQNAANDTHATLWYVRAADAWLEQQETAKAYALLSSLDTDLMSKFIKNQYALFKAESLIRYQKYAQAFPLIKDIDTLQGFEARLFLAQSVSASNTQHFLEAANARINLKNWLTDTADIDQQNSLIWQDLINLESTAFSYFQSPDKVELSAWLALLNITHSYAHSAEQLLINIRRWQAQNPSHPAAQQLPEKLQLALAVETFTPQKVAVFLPLSGKFHKQGEAIQQGILAARFSPISSNATIEFIDTNLWQADQALNPSEFIAAEYDFIIGPLLKDNIVKLNGLGLEIPKLWLNALNDELELSETEYSFTLAPEAEAIQAASKMIKLGYKKPIVLAAADSKGKRMAEAFRQHFLAETENEPEISYFSNTSEMKKSVEQLMETGPSKSRIKSIKLLFEQPKQFEADARNRRDIDVIYIIADATQTQILKPFIDVNTAPFARLIPIYASSRSYSSELNQADLRDLNQVVFSDIPWRLPGKANQAVLAEQMKSIWKDQNDDLSPFFALGYDSFNLLPNLAKMRVFPGFIHQGLTGDIKLSAQGNVERDLRWAKFENGRITNVALISERQ